METETSARKKLFSGIQPSGILTLGNYVGALSQFSALQEEYDCVYCIVDEHAITVRQEPAMLRRRSIELAAMYMASGLDPDKCIVYCQSHVSAHAELAWILNCFTYTGELNRMTQFKDKSAKHADNINAGLYTYPVLMAADILLYRADVVPIGNDQKQHLELCRDIAQRFNAIYGDVFTVPEGIFRKVGARIMSLQEPTRKMSKSDPPDTFISLLDSPDEVRRKIKRAVTDSEAEIRFDFENKPGVSNLLSMISVLEGRDMSGLCEELSGRGYGELKSRAADSIIAVLEPMRKKYDQLMSDKGAIQEILFRNADKAAAIANRTLRKVQKKIGFLPRA